MKDVHDLINDLYKAHEEEQRQKEALIHLAASIIQLGRDGIEDPIHRAKLKVLSDDFMACVADTYEPEELLEDCEYPVWYKDLNW